MIDRRAFDAAWMAVGWDNQNPHATEGQERFIAAYEAAKLANLPNDRVERVARAMAAAPHAPGAAPFSWQQAALKARAALAALETKPVVENSKECACDTFAYADGTQYKRHRCGKKPPREGLR